MEPSESRNSSSSTERFARGLIAGFMLSAGRIRGGQAVSEAGKDSPSATPAQRALIGLYLMIVALVFGWMFIAIFPSVPKDGTAPKYGTWSIFGRLIVGPQPTSAHESESSFRSNVESSAEFSRPMIVLDTDRGLILLAMLAGILGSFMHASQSFAAYVGYRQLKESWIWWYILRPYVGAVLGVLFYFVIRAGLLGSDGSSVSPYGVVALGGLAGWFSKNATDKLSEVFETLFKTSKPLSKDALDQSVDAPRIDKVTPSVVEPAATPPQPVRLRISGVNFVKSVQVTIDDVPVSILSLSDTEIEVEVDVDKRPKPGVKAKVCVIRTEPARLVSEPVEVEFK